MFSIYRKNLMCPQKRKEFSVSIYFTAVAAFDTERDITAQMLY